MTGIFASFVKLIFPAADLKVFKLAVLPTTYKHVPGYPLFGNKLYRQYKLI